MPRLALRGLANSAALVLLLSLFSSSGTKSAIAAEPGDVLNICTNGYQFGGLLQSSFTNLRAKLSNTDLFGENGSISTSSFTIKDIVGRAGPPSAAALASENCHIWFSGYDDPSANFAVLKNFADNGGFVISGCEFTSSETSRDAVCKAMGYPTTSHKNGVGLKPETITGFTNPLSCDTATGTAPTAYRTFGTRAYFAQLGATALGVYVADTSKAAVITDNLSDPTFLLGGGGGGGETSTCGVAGISHAITHKSEYS